MRPNAVRGAAGEGTGYQETSFRVTPDVDNEIEGFNERIVAENFDRVVCTGLANHAARTVMMSGGR